MNNKYINLSLWLVYHFYRPIDSSNYLFCYRYFYNINLIVDLGCQHYLAYQKRIHDTRLLIIIGLDYYRCKSTSRYIIYFLSECLLLELRTTTHFSLYYH